MREDKVVKSLPTYPYIFFKFKKLFIYRKKEVVCFIRNKTHDFSVPGNGRHMAVKW